jgi:hypothetical protein
MCTSVSGKNLTCSSTLGHSGSSLAMQFFNTNETSTTSFFDLATKIQSRIFVFLPVISVFIFLFAVVFLVLLHLDVKRINTTEKAVNRRFMLRKAGKSSAWFSLALIISSSVGTQQTAAALEFISVAGKEDVLIKSGTSLLVLQWFIVAFTAIFAAACRLIYNQGGPQPSGEGPGVMGDNGKEFVPF